MRALLGGDAAAARPLLERAAALDPGSPMLWLNLALAQRELKDEGVSATALERALVADPRYFPALLHKARLFERRQTQAGRVHVPRFSLLRSPGVQHPPAVRSAIEHANQVLRENDAALDAFLRRGWMRRARAMTVRGSSASTPASIRSSASAGVRAAADLHAVPRLPAIEFLDREAFPWLDAFDAATDEIRAEARAALAQAADDFVPYISKPAGSPVDQWVGSTTRSAGAPFS